MKQYRFTFDRNRLVILLGGTLLAGVLMFAAGVLAGVALYAPAKAEIAMLKEHEEQMKLAAAKPAPVAPPAAAPPQPIAAVAPAAAAPVQAPQPAPAPVVMAAAAPAMPVAPKPVPGPADLLGAETAPEKDIFSLQIGAYRDAKEARDVLTTLRERGYPAAIYTNIDEEKREWHTVRIGGFPTLAKASAAASVFTSRERLQALIRPSDSL